MPSELGVISNLGDAIVHCMLFMLQLGNHAVAAACA
jgi:hypothetical protein